MRAEMVESVFRMYGLDATDRRGARAITRGQLVRVTRWEGDQPNGRLVGVMEACNGQTLHVRPLQGGKQVAIAHEDIIAIQPWRQGEA